MNDFLQILQYSPGEDLLFALEINILSAISGELFLSVTSIGQKMTFYVFLRGRAHRNPPSVRH